MFWSCEQQDWFENLCFEPTSDLICETKHRQVALNGYYEPYNLQTENKFDINHYLALIRQYTGTFASDILLFLVMFLVATLSTSAGYNTDPYSLPARNLSSQTDAHAAFEGILRRISRVTGHQFHWGHLLNSDFGQTLTFSAGSIRRNAECTILDEDGQLRKVKFPSWSWLGWQDQIAMPAPNALSAIPVLEFYKVDIHDRDTAFLPENNGVKRAETAISGSAKWKGETKISGQPHPRSSDAVLRDSGKIRFWTSHAQFYLKQSTKVYTKAAQFLQWEIIDSNGKYVGLLESGLVPEKAREDERFSFIVVSKTRSGFGGRSGADVMELDVLLVAWVGREAHLAERVTAGYVVEEEWVSAEREWILVTLQ